MELIYTCKGCNKDRVLASEAKNRKELYSEAGEEKFEVHCPFCEVNHTIHVNHVTAMKTTFEKFAPFIYWKISLLFIFLVFSLPTLYTFAFCIASIAIPVFIYNRIDSKVQTFNELRFNDSTIKTK